MLDKILDSKTAQKIFIQLYHYGESYPSGVARDFKISFIKVQRKFDRFKDAGILVSKLVGRTRGYQFNKKQGAVVKHFMALIKVIYDSILLSEKEEIFSTRRRPRKKGKPVLGKNK